MTERERIERDVMDTIRRDLGALPILHALSVGGEWLDYLLRQDVSDALEAEEVRRWGRV